MATRYTDEFRLDAVRIAISSGLTRPQVSSNLGVGLSTLNKWVQRHQQDDLMSGPHENVEKEKTRLRKEVRLLREEKVVRPITHVRVWNLTFDHAEALAEQLRQDGFDAAATENLETAVGAADINTSATLATDPIIKGSWLKPGQHVDLIGSFTPKMREADDEAILRARVFIDADGALKESGDIIDPIASGVLTKDQICADLAALCRHQASGRTSPDEITLFKGVGTALEDLAAAGLVYGHHGK